MSAHRRVMLPTPSEDTSRAQTISRQGWGAVLPDWYPPERVGRFRTWWRRRLARRRAFWQAIEGMAEGKP